MVQYSKKYLTKTRTFGKTPRRMMHVWVVIVLLSLAARSADAQFEDVRCKCVCPTSGSKPEIIVKNIPPEECKCGLVTQKNETECLKCECEFQSRNTFIMKIGVIFVICLISALFIYLVILLLLDRSAATQAISVQQEDQAAHLSSQQETGADSHHSANNRGFHSWISSAHRRWNAKVQKQREVIFENQTILS